MDTACFCQENWKDIGMKCEVFKGTHQSEAGLGREKVACISLPTTKQVKMLPCYRAGGGGRGKGIIFRLQVKRFIYCHPVCLQTSIPKHSIIYAGPVSSSNCQTEHFKNYKSREWGEQSRRDGDGGGDYDDVRSSPAL